MNPRITVWLYSPVCTYMLMIHTISISRNIVFDMSLNPLVTEGVTYLTLLRI